MKKIISIILVILMVAMMFPVSVFAENTDSSESFPDTEGYETIACESTRLCMYNGYYYVVVYGSGLYRYSLDFSSKKLLMSFSEWAEICIYNNVIYVFRNNLIAYDIATGTAETLSSDYNDGSSVIYDNNIYFVTRSYSSSDYTYSVKKYDIEKRQEKVICSGLSTDITICGVKDNYLFYSFVSKNDRKNFTAKLYRYNMKTESSSVASMTMPSEFCDVHNWGSFGLDDFLIADEKIYVTLGCIEGTGTFYNGCIFVSEYNSLSFSMLPGSLDKTGKNLYYVNEKVYVTSRYDKYSGDYGLLCVDNLSTNVLEKSIKAQYGNCFIYLDNGSLYLLDMKENTEKLIVDVKKYEELFEKYKKEAMNKNSFYKDEYFKIQYSDLIFDGQSIGFSASLVVPAGYVNNMNATIHRGEYELLSLVPPPFLKNKYIADIWLSKKSGSSTTIENGYINSFLSNNGHFSSGLANELLDNEEFSASVAAWKSLEVIFNPAESTAELVYLDQNEIYQTLIFDLLKQCLTDDEFGQLISSEWLQIVDSVVGAFGTGGTILEELNISDFEKFKKLALGDSIEFSQKYFKMLYDNFKASDKVFKNIDNFCFIAKGIIEGVSTVTDFINQVTMYYVAMKLSMEQSAVLYEMATHTSSKSLKDALNTVADIAENKSFSTGLLKAIAGAADKTGVYITAFVADETMKLIPVYGTLKLVYDVASSAVDILLNTNGIIDAYYLILCTAELCNASRLSINGLATKYEEDATEVNAGAYIESVKMYVRLISIDLESGCKFVKAASEDGLFNLAKKIDRKILEFFGLTIEDTYDEVCQSKDNIIQSVSLSYDWLETSWILNEDYLKSDYPDIYPIYAKQEIMKYGYKPAVTNVRLNKKGETELQFSFINWVDGIDVEEYIEEETKEYTCTDTENIICYDESKKDIFPKYYTAYSYFDSDEGHIQSAPSTIYVVSAPLKTPFVKMPTLRDMLVNGNNGVLGSVTIAILDDTNTYYDNVKYHVYRKIDDADYEKIAIVNRNNLYDGKTTLFTDRNTVPGSKYSYKVQSEMTFGNGVTIISDMSDSVAFGDSAFGAGVNSISLNDMRVQNNQQSRFALMSSVENVSDNIDGIKITWSNAENISGYEIYRAESFSEKFELVGTVENGNSFIDTSVREGLNYDYCVTAFVKADDAVIYSGNTQVERISYHRLRINDNIEEMYVNSDYSFTVSSSVENDSFVWVVSDDSVASIDTNGKLTAIKTGEVTVTVINSLGITDSVDIVIINAPVEEHKHTPGSWKIVVEAQVGADGLEQQKCTVCGEVLDERVIPALPDVSYMTGDANGDGKITAADARIALRVSARVDKLEDYNLTVAAIDVTADGKITAADARKILRIAAKIE